MTRADAPPLRRTPLYGAHLRRGARMVAFAGWEMPVQFAGILDEHRAVRSAVGCFDVSHMGEFEVAGPDAARALNALTTNDVAALGVGQGQYTLFCAEDGGIVDDLTLARVDAERYLLTVNAATRESDWEWLTRHLDGRVQARDVSEATGLVAVQGPRAEALVAALADVDVGKLGYYRLTRGRVAGVAALISRTGYTGEDGFELYLPAEETERVWEVLLERGRPLGAVPAGLGARDTLRLEMRYCLYGHDIDRTTNPYEAGLGWVVKLDKGDFVGREALRQARVAGPRRRLVGFEMVERAVPREGYRLLREGTAIGRVTSGGYGPSVDRYIGLGYVAAEWSEVGTELDVEVRGRACRARVVRTPFYTPRVRRQGG